jgi:hypothetical protein
MPAATLSTTIYSCTFADYDYTFGPLARTPGARFLRYGTSRPNRWRIWEHRPVPAAMTLPTQTMTNRRFKMFPGEAVPPCDVAVYVDGHILIRADLTPLIAAFWESGADIALFPHPSGRTLEQEIDFALAHSIPARDAPLAEAQRVRYRKLGLLETPVTENTILFYRMTSPAIAEIGATWWAEMERYSKRDQISLPYVLDRVGPRVHRWDWHFHAPSARNAYFARASHRPRGLAARTRRAAHFMKDYAPEYRALYGALKAGGALRALPGRALRRLRGAEDGDA